MKQRSRARLFCVAVCATGALLCAVNHAPLLAAAHGIAAIAVWRFRFGRSLGAGQVDALIVRLSDAREARTDASERATMIRATVMPNVIAAPMPALRATRWTQAATAFRDELSAERWRQLTTALRHQPRSAAALLPTSKTRDM